MMSNMYENLASLVIEDRVIRKNTHGRTQIRVPNFVHVDIGQSLYVDGREYICVYWTGSRYAFLEPEILSAINDSLQDHDKED